MNSLTTFWLSALVVLAVNACSILILPETAKGGSQSPPGGAVSVTLPNDLRIHDCLEAQVSLKDANGQTEAPSAPITVSIVHTGDVHFYASLSDCAGNLDEISSVVLTPDEPVRTIYFQTSSIQNVTIGVSHPNYGSSSQSGTTTFTRTGYNRVSGPGGDILTMGYQPVTGKLVIGGKFASWDDRSQNRIARLLSDGTLDTTFVTGTGFDNTVNDIAFFPDGRVIVGGWFSTYNGAPCNVVCVLNVDGTIDTGFTSPANLQFVNAVAVQSDGKIVVGGGFNLGFGNARDYIARLTSTGALDSLVNFSNANAPNNNVFSLTIQADGKILVGGEFTQFGATARNRILRLNTDGTLDVTFAPPAGADARVTKMLVRGDGKIWVAGHFSNFNGVAAHDNLAVIESADGTSDAAALTELPNFFVYSMAIQADDKLVIAGSFNSVAGTARPGIARLNANGTLDTSYLPTGQGTNKTVYALAMATDESVVFGGEFGSFGTASRNRLVKLDGTGALQTTYSPRAALNYYGKSLGLQSTGKLLVGGDFTAHDGNSANGMVRVDSAGNIDSTFSVGAGCASFIPGSFNTIAVMSDDRFYAGGSYDQCQGSPRGSLARFLADGALDPSFTTPNSGFDHYVHSVKLQPDGKIVVGGSFQNYGLTAKGRVARLNSDGTNDTSFTGAGANATVWYVGVQNDGKILVAGDFATYNGLGYPNLVRLNADGSVDTTFDTTAGLGGTVFDAAIFPDGKILAVGNFVSPYGNVAYRGAVRLHPDGSIDTSYTPPHFGGWVTSVELLPDGSAVVGTHSTEAGGAGQKELTLLTPTGVYDTDFVVGGGGLDDFVNRVLIQPNGKIVVTGEFTSTFNATFGYLLRLTRTGAID